MSDNENDILRDAIIATDKEIAGNVWDQDSITHDETGDRSHEAMGTGLEGQNEPDEDEVEDATEGDEDPANEAEPGDAKAKAEAEAKAAAEAEAARQDDKRRVPAGRLREQTEMARAAQAERDAAKAELAAEKAASQKSLAEITAKHDALMTLLQRQQATAPPKAADPDKPKIPDILEDPQGYADFVKKQVDEGVSAVRKDVNDRFLNASMQSAHSRHGEAFDKAYKALTSLNPQNREHAALVQSILAQPDPGEAAVAWHKRNEALREIGEDPVAYKARIAEETRKALAADPEFRKQMIQGIRADALAENDGEPRNVFKLPPSLNRAAGGNTRSPNDLSQFDGSESAIANSVWS